MKTLAPKSSSLTNMYWLVKREFWENRGGFLWAPVITGGVFLLLNLMGIVTGEVIGAQHGFHFLFNDRIHILDHTLDADEAAKAGMLMEVDGEVKGRFQEISAEILPGAVQLMVPA